MEDALVIRNLSKRFGGLRAVQDVSFSVRENETLALIGPNGAGKTTAFNLIMGFHRPDSGSVTAFGREVVGMPPHDVCAHGLAHLLGGQSLRRHDGTRQRHDRGLPAPSKPGCSAREG